MRRFPPKPPSRREIEASRQLHEPLEVRSCVCPEPESIKTGDGIRRCLKCAGTVERQPQLPAEWRTA